jgi:hypothetical protein
MEVIAALVGAAAGALLTIATTWFQRRGEDKRRLAAVKAAISAEIGSLIGTARRNGYEAELRDLAARTASCIEDALLPRFRVAVGTPTFTVYQANANVIGDMPARNAVDVVLFYQRVASWLVSAAFVAEADFSAQDRDNLAAFYNMLAENLAELDIEGNRLIGQLATPALANHIRASNGQIAVPADNPKA